MRILFVAEQYPWPAVDGYRHRMDHVVRGLARAGEVDVVALHRPGTAEPIDPRIPGVTVHPVPVGPDAGARQWIRSWVTDGVPRRVFGPDWSEAIDVIGRITTSSGVGRHYDLVWFSHVHTWYEMNTHVLAARAIVDFDNLENIALQLRRRVPPRPAPGSSVSGRAATLARWLSSRAFDVVDERRWDRLQRRSADHVDRVAVCSQLDVERSGCPNAVVVGNGAQRPESVDTERATLRAAGMPTMLFVGALDYEPNTEAVEWFAREIFPRVSARVPGARARIVGRGRSRLGWISGIDGIDLVGAVASVGPELAGADVSIVPITVGAGTRLKVVEALANHIPIVTTTVGCEGIDLVDGETALIADDPQAFADACVRLLDDGPLRQRLADNGAALFASTYDWDLIEQRIADLARELIAER